MRRSRLRRRVWSKLHALFCRSYKTDTIIGTMLNARNASLLRNAKQLKHVWRRLKSRLRPVRSRKRKRSVARRRHKLKLRRRKQGSQLNAPKLRPPGSVKETFSVSWKPLIMRIARRTTRDQKKLHHKLLLLHNQRRTLVSQCPNHQRQWLWPQLLLPLQPQVSLRLTHLMPRLEIPSSKTCSKHRLQHHHHQAFLSLRRQRPLMSSPQIHSIVCL